MTLTNEADYDKIKEGDTLVIEGFATAVSNSDDLTLVNKSTGDNIPLTLNLTKRQREVLAAGGMMNYIGKKL